MSGDGEGVGERAGDGVDVGPAADLLDGGPGGLSVPVLRLDPDLPMPGYAHPGDAGLDLYARVDVTLEPGERAAVPCGIALALPVGYVGLVTPRSGLAARYGLGMVNSPGVIDSGYRGELAVLLINHDRTDAVTLRRGERVAQLLVLVHPQVHLMAVEQLPGSRRGVGGFGSSGR